MNDVILLRKIIFSKREKNTEKMELILTLTKLSKVLSFITLQ